MEKDVENQHADYMEVLLSAGPSREFYKQLVYDMAHNKYGLYSDMRTALGIRGVSVPIVGGEFKENTFSQNSMSNISDPGINVTS